MNITATRPHARTYPSSAAIGETIQRVFDRVADEDGDAVCVTDGELRLSRTALRGAAGALQTRLRGVGVRAGDVVTVQLPNWWQTLSAMHAAWGLGAVVNPVTPIYRGGELRTILASSRPRAVVVPLEYRGVDYSGMVAEALGAAGRDAAVLTVDRSAPPSSAPFTAAPGDPDGVAMLMYTSGTTGRPKGVLHTPRTLLYEAASIGTTFGLRGDAVFMPSPLSHVTGLLYGVLMPLVTGGSVTLLDRWDPQRALEAIESSRCAFTVSATPFLRGLADSYERAGTRSALRSFVCGGADIPPALVRRAEAVMGTSVSRTYGSTEMPTLCIVRPDDSDEVRLSSEGRPIGAAEGRLAASDAGAGAGDGVGELEVHGPELFVGYLDPADNGAAFTDDDWFRTGDLARIGPDGTVTIVGRLKDVIVRGGENISAKEVEDLLATHPAIRDVSVVGIPDPVMGERACAVVVTDDPDLGLRELAEHLDLGRIAKQKYPEAVYRIDELPRTVSGKVQKFQLRELLVTALAEGRVELR